MTKVIYLPLEPIDNRCFGYWFNDFFNALRKEFGTVYRVPAIASEVSNDTGHTGILDIIGTTKWKSSQLEIVTDLFKDGEIEDGDILVFDDLWFPGIETYRYLADAMGIKIYIVGCLHGGTWVPKDYTCSMKWAEPFEHTILSAVDVVILATRYHRDLLTSALPCHNLDTTYLVTGYPVLWDEIVAKYDKEPKDRGNIIIYSQRIDDQKCSRDVFDAVDRLWDMRKDFSFVITSSTTKKLRLNDDVNSLRFQALKERMGNNLVIYENLSRDQYFELLSMSKVFISLAEGETFGYALVESLTAGVTPIVRNGVTHNEILMDDTRFLCTDLDEVPNRLSWALDNPQNLSHLTKRYERHTTFERMAGSIRRTLGV